MTPVVAKANVDPRVIGAGSEQEPVDFYLFHARKILSLLRHRVAYAL